MRGTWTLPLVWTPVAQAPPVLAQWWAVEKQHAREQLSISFLAQQSLAGSTQTADFTLQFVCDKLAPVSSRGWTSLAHPFWQALSSSHAVTLTSVHCPAGHYIVERFSTSWHFVGLLRISSPSPSPSWILCLPLRT